MNIMILFFLHLIVCDHIASGYIFYNPVDIINCFPIRIRIQDLSFHQTSQHTHIDHSIHDCCDAVHYKYLLSLTFIYFSLDMLSMQQGSDLPVADANWGISYLFNLASQWLFGRSSRTTVDPLIQSITTLTQIQVASDQEVLPATSQVEPVTGSVEGSCTAGTSSGFAGKPLDEVSYNQTICRQANPAHFFVSSRKIICCTAEDSIDHKLLCNMMCCRTHVISCIHSEVNACHKDDSNTTSMQAQLQSINVISNRFINSWIEVKIMPDLIQISIDGQIYQSINLLIV